jgi:hypothetical protein
MVFPAQRNPGNRALASAGIATRDVQLEILPRPSPQRRLAYRAFEEGDVMSSGRFVFNGVNGATGSYLTPPLPAEAVALVALGQPVSPDHLQSLEIRYRADQPHYGVSRGVKAEDLSSAGWGVLFHYDYDPAIKDALQELLEHRRSEAAKVKSHYYREYLHNVMRFDRDRPGAFLPGDTPRTWLERNGALAHQAANPEKVPYYLLIVASPEQIPYEFQYELDVQYAVGRLWFEEDGKPDLQAFANYARSVVTAERAPVSLPRRAVFFGTEHDNDEATWLSAHELVGPLAEALTKEDESWKCPTALGAAATKSRLAELLGGGETPAFLFTASHGMGFPADEPRQARHQGALLCQDFQGRLHYGVKAVKEDEYFSADDIGDDARLLGLISFHFACYGAGTPSVDDFDHVPALAGQSCATPRPVVARLPQRLLSHPKGGALAVVGHIDRAWSCSFHNGDRLRSQIDTFKDTLAELLDGKPLGYALEYFNQYHASLGTSMGEILKKVRQFSYNPNPLELADVWTADNDARNYVVLGDPAVRVCAVPAGADAASVRPTIPTVALPKAEPAQPVASPASPTETHVVQPQSFSLPADRNVQEELDQLLRAAAAAAAEVGVRVRFRVEIEPPGA